MWEEWKDIGEMFFLLLLPLIVTAVGIAMWFLWTDWIWRL